MSEDKPKPGLNEQTFARLLEAAYVLQEHNREMRRMEERLESQSEQLRQQEAETQAALLKSTRRPQESERPTADYTLTLAEIVEAQHQIQIRHLQSDQAMAVVAERTTRITGASGAGIGILEGKIIRYHAGAGSAALPVGTEAPLEKAICAICVRTGQVLRTPDVNTEFLFDPELCHPRGIQSLVAVPIYHDGTIVGALELYFDRLKGFAEQDIHTCQLMAGLVTEAIGRGAELALKKSMAEERSSMMAAIERLKPSLLPFADEQKPAVEERGPIAPQSAERPVAPEAFRCWKCEGKLLGDEQFCGKCGAPRFRENDPATLQSKVTSAWQTEQAALQGSLDVTDRIQTRGTSEGLGARLNATSHEMNLPELAASLKLEEETRLSDRSGAELGGEKSSTDLALPAGPDDLMVPAPNHLANTEEQDATWTSAAKARDFLEGLQETNSSNGLAHFWRARRGDFYLAFAVILVAAVIRWGILSGDSVGATGGSGVSTSASRHKQTAADTNLSTFDKLLIGLGLAEAPETPEYKGNPDTQVWVDVHTALYYCPGSELYGKTPKGKYTSQREAQLDQFESASRKVCD